MASTLRAETRQIWEPNIVRVLLVTAQRTKVFSGATADNEGDFAAQDWALFFGISLIWGASFLLIAEALEAFTPGIVTLGRASLGALVMWIMRLTLRRGQHIDPQDRAPTPLLVSRHFRIRQ